MIDGDAGRRQHVAEDAQRLEPADPVGRDRLAGHRPQLGRGARPVERRRIEPDAVDGVPHDRLREHLGRGVVAVHLGVAPAR